MGEPSLFRGNEGSDILRGLLNDRREVQAVIRLSLLRKLNGPRRIAAGQVHQAGGSTLVWFGLTWSLELYQQTNARLWRQGQQAETVVIHHIITTDTIDEQIMDALERKDRTQAALIDAVRAQLGV